jgi:hypothetical protein
MTTEDSRSGRHDATDPPNRTADVYEEEFSLLPLGRTLWSYRRVIVIAVSGILFVFLLWGFATYAFQPVEQRASLEFRLIFEGADRGEYPNGLNFSSAEIIATPVLTEVYEINELERYSTYESFKNRIVILEANRELELLGFEYQAKLTDPGVSPVDRAILEAEFHQKRQALRVAQYGVNFIGSKTETSIPDVLLNKVLNDILAVWAEQVTTRKGVLTVQGITFTKNLLREEFLKADDYIVRGDMLRRKVNRLIDGLRALETLPGASVLRIEEAGILLSEIRINLEDLMTYRLEPLVGYVWGNSFSRSPELLRPYLENRQFQVDLDRQQAEGQGRLLEESLRGYLAKRATSASGYGFEEVRSLVDGGGGNSATGQPPGRATAIVPQFGDSFLDRLLAMAVDTEDLAFRQELTNRLIAVRQNAVNLERETSYYERMNQLMLSTLSASSQEVLDPEVERLVEARFAAIYDAVFEALGQSDTFLTQLSAQNLNPQTNLFTMTAPFTMTTLRSFTLQTLAVYGLVVLMLGLMMVPLACLIHHYFRRELLSPPAVC